MNEIIQRTIKNLENNNIKTYYVDKKEEVIPLIEKLVCEGSSVAAGGSVTLDETGVTEHIRSGRYKFFDRYKEGLTRDEVNDIHRQSFFADAYFTSTNAITEDGELYNVDGNSNRITAIAFGPKTVVVIAGVNKIVKDIDEAVKRVKTIAAPKNCQRLGCRTYCYEKGHCVDMDGGIGKGCDSPQRICRNYLVSAKQRDADRIKVILVNENLGY